MRSIFASVIVMTVGLTACGGSSTGPGEVASRFVAALDSGDLAAATRFVYQPDPALPQQIRSILSGLAASSVRRSTGRPATRGSASSVPLTSAYSLGPAATWTVAGSIELHRHGGAWLVDWTPGIVAPGLTAGLRLASSYTWPDRAPILGAGGASLTPDQAEVTVGIEGSRMKDPAPLTAALESTGASAAQIQTALSAATAHPTYFEPVATITAAAYAALGGSSGALHATPGTVFQFKTTRGPLTVGLGSHLVGSVGPITAEELRRLGAPYAAGSSVGQTGLEAAYEKQLAGSPAVIVQSVDAGGSPARTLASFPARPGKAVTTTIDPGVQAAAEAATAPVAGTAALVAVRVSTGELLASVSKPDTSAFDEALGGSFPPGSTFKILTAAALVQAGLTPSSPAACPPATTVDGESFHNAEGDQPVATMADAFAESCNTAFVRLATDHLHADDFPSVAKAFGLGAAYQLGLPAFAGRVPPPADGAGLAATSIGQASVVVSPLDMAMVAAAVGSGTARLPRLVTGAPDDGAPAIPLPSGVSPALQQMMSLVVTKGTAAGTGLPPGTLAKTGTAQYGTGSPLPIDAWLVGYYKDIAFAMVEQAASGNGGPVDGPVVARFLAAAPAQ